MTKINTIFNYNDALNICMKSYKNIKESKIKTPINVDIFNNYKVEIPETLKNPIWKITNKSIENTLDYIYNVICHQCYLFTIVDGKKTFYKLLPDKLSQNYLNAISNAKHEVNNNKWLTDYQKVFIHKMHPNRIMQCIVKNVDMEKELTKHEYLELFKTYDLPDGIFILNLTDAVIMRKDNLHPFQLVMNYSNDKKFDKKDEYLPILTISGQRGYIDIPIPNYDDITLMNKTTNIYSNFITNWKDKKINKAVFRGSPTGCGYTSETNMRLKLYELSLLDEYKDILDVGITGKQQLINTHSIKFDPRFGLGMLNTNIKSTDKFLQMYEQSNYKYIIHIDGNVNAYRLLYTMSTGSIILRVESEYTSWAEHYLFNSFNYIKIKSDLSDLKQKIEWCNNHPNECELISKQAVDLSKVLLNKTFIKNYFYKIFWNFELIKKSTKIYFKNYQEYKKNRITINPPILDKFIEPDHAKIAIIVPHRNRIDHLEKFIKHFNKLQTKHKFDIFIINQHNNLKFNRGLLLNIGYYIASHNKYDRYIFHDVDLYPDETLFKLYFNDLDKIIHFATDHYKYKFPEFFGGVEGFNSVDFELINGFPNNFFGWGGEDDALYNRLVINNLLFYRPKHGKYIVEDHPQSTDINPDKKTAILNDLSDWNKNGIKQIEKIDLIVNEQSMDEFIDTYNDKKLVEQYKLNYLVKKIDFKQKYHFFNIDFDINSNNEFIKINTDECNLDHIKDSVIYKADKSKKYLLCNIYRIIRNFKNYLLNEPNIDYTYIWNLIKPLNLIIFDMPLNDGSDYVDLVCPPIVYDTSDTAYFMLLKKGNIYNPIVAHKQSQFGTEIVFQFDSKNNTLNYNLYRFLNLIPNLFNRCKSEYKHSEFINNISIMDALTIIDTLPKYKVNILILNHFFEIIGISLKFESIEFVLYCIPISLNSFKNDRHIMISFHNEIDTYVNTKYCLESLYNDSNHEIPCKPIRKILDENNLIIGILTEANTFVEVIPDISIDDNLVTYRDLNHNLIDSQLLNYPINDNINQHTVNIETETKLYNLFRLFIKNNISKSIDKREELLSIYNSNDEYNIKLKHIYDFLIKSYKHKIIFKEINNIYDLQKLNKCIGSKKNCDIIIPLYNIVTGEKNDIIYFSRLSDEILRYKLIHNFILKDNTYLPFYDTQYKINNDEILISKNLIDSYFDNIEPLKPHENTSYNNINDKLQTIYRNIHLNEYIENNDCYHIKKIIDTRKLSFNYPVLKERIYINSSICTIQLIIDIINDFTSQKYEYVTIRQLLLKLYKQYPLPNILSILYKEGKQLNTINYVLDDKYYLTPFDFKVLSVYFKLPIIIDKEHFIENISKKIYCITHSQLNNNIIPSYSIIMDNEILFLNYENITFNTKFININEYIINTKIYKQFSN